jgi:hypothetical protein
VTSSRRGSWGDVQRLALKLDCNPESVNGRLVYATINQNLALARMVNRSVSRIAHGGGATAPLKRAFRAYISSLTASPTFPLSSDCGRVYALAGNIVSELAHARGSRHICVH